MAGTRVSQPPQLPLLDPFAFPLGQRLMDREQNAVRDLGLTLPANMGRLWPRIAPTMNRDFNAFVVESLGFEG